MLNNLTVPDYVSLLHLCGQETEFPLIPACLITYFHFRCSGSVSVPLGQTWGQRWVKEQCTTSAVSARFKRLAVKYGSWLKLMDGNLMLSGAIPISKPQTIVHKLNQTIVLLCLERLETCLPAEYATAHATDSGDGDKIPSDQINLYHAKTVEHQRLLKVTKDILYQQYVTRRSHLSEQLKELDSTWNTPLTKLAAELELELQNWTVDGNAATTTTKTARKPRQRMLQGATNEEKQSDLTSSIRTHIRNVWQQGTEHAKQRVIEGQLTSEHPFKDWIRALYPRIGKHSLSVIAQEFPELKTLADHANDLLRDDEHPEILQIFQSAYDGYLREPLVIDKQSLRLAQLDAAESPAPPLALSNLQE